MKHHSSYGPWLAALLGLGLLPGLLQARDQERWAQFKPAPGMEAPATVEPSLPLPPVKTIDSPARRTLERESYYDPGNPDLGRLQRIEEATAILPHDSNGFPDWMRALREGSITPRESLGGKGKMEVLDLDIIMRNTKEMPHVRFPHKSHTLWLACTNCHPDPFQPVAGSTAIRMADIFRGQYCGKCHDRVAFITFFSCQRCHSVPQQGSASGSAPSGQ